MKNEVVLYKDENDSVGTVIHSSFPNLPKMHTATLTLGLNSVDSIEFAIGVNNPGFNLVTPMRSRVKVFEDNSLIFFGRVVKPMNSMDSSTAGLVLQTFDANSIEDYLHDSVQKQQKVASCSLQTYLTAIINQHNSQVESYKKFKVGKVTVTDPAGNTDRYLDYETTFDAITNRLINVYGGYITVDYDSMSINYLSNVGEKGTTPLKLGFNLKSASKTIDPSAIITRLVPTGADIDSNSDTTDTTDTSSLSTDKQPTTPKTVLPAPGYVDNQSLINEFGIVEGTQSFDNVTDQNALKSQAQSWLTKQNTAVESWEITVSNLHFIDMSIDDFKVGNQYQFINDFVSESEWLQVVELDLDLVTPINSTIKIGNINLNFSAYVNDKVKQTQSSQKKISLLNQLVVSQSKTISKLSDDYTSLASTMKNIIDNNNIWLSGDIFVDVSSNNEDDSIAWFTKIVNAGAKGLIVKLSQSTDYTNPLAATQIANGQSVGLKFIGGYHYFMGSGATEGQYFLAQLQALNIPKSAIVVCDIEDSSIDPTPKAATITKDELNAQIAAFWQILAAAGYANTCEYSSASYFGTWFDSTAKYKWISDYDASSRPDGSDAWQFSNNWNSLGVDASKSFNKAFV